MFRSISLVMFSVVLFAAVGCGDTVENDGDAGTEGSAVALVIVGDYADAFGGAHTITAESYSQVYAGSAPMVFNVERYDNDEEYFVAQNDSENEFSPDLFSRFDWVFEDDALYICQGIFDAADADTAAASARPDDSEPGTKGCGGQYPWTALTAAE